MRLLARRRLFVPVIVVAVLTSGALTLGLSNRLFPHSMPVDLSLMSDVPAEENEDPRPAVVTIRPRLDPSFVITVQQPAFVEPYFRANLLPQVSGRVRYIFKDKGARVRRNELLARIDVPDLVEDLAQRESMIAQREREVEQARAKAKIAEAQVEVALKNVVIKTAFVGKAIEDRNFSKLELERLQKLAAKGVVLGDVVEAEEHHLQAAEVGIQAARAAVEKARADVEEMRASLTSARADIEYHQAQVTVARKDRDKARATVDLAEIRSPFDGVIVERHIDVGSYVQNTNPAVALAVARLDFVTIHMKLPDDYADLLTLNTEATIQIDKRPGLLVRGRVSRFSPLIEGSDRTLRVEVDLYNSGRPAYDDLAARTVADGLATLAANNPFAATNLLRRDRAKWERVGKSGLNLFPAYPEVSGTATDATGTGWRLLPGMYGRMTLALENLGRSYLLPSGAVFGRGGKRYLMEVRDGKAVLVPVEVQVDDGKLVKLVVVNSEGGRGRKKKDLRELTGDEEIVLSGQAELTDGQEVRPVPGTW